MSATFKTVQLASMLEKDAGSYLVTADPRALSAVDRASGQADERFPYLEARYGGRGRSFTRCDGGWLVLLAEVPEPAVLQQILWLGRVLAARGMPRIVLESFLFDLVESLREAIPEEAEAWTRLSTACARLSVERTSRLSDEAAALLVAPLEAVRTQGNALPTSDTPLLLGAALADERAGLQRAVPSLVAWIADPSRFDAGWCRAVELVVKGAREIPG